MIYLIVLLILIIVTSLYLDYQESKNKWSDKGDL